MYKMYKIETVCLQNKVRERHVVLCRLPRRFCPMCRFFPPLAFAKRSVKIEVYIVFSNTVFLSFSIIFQQSVDLISRI